MKIKSLLRGDTDSDILFGNEMIPKHSAVAIMNGMPRFDETYWEKPGLFYPDRFKFNLDKDIYHQQLQAKIPESVFSYGGRICPAHNNENGA